MRPARRAALAEVARRGARLALAATIVLSPFRAAVDLVPRPSVPVYADFTDLLVTAGGWALLITLALWLISRLLRPRSLDTGPRFLAWPAAGLVAVAVAGAIVATDAPLALWNAAWTVLLAAFALYLLDDVRVADVAVPVAVMVALQAVVGLAQVISQHSVGLAGLGELALAPGEPVSVITGTDGVRILRAYGLADHPNILGGLLACALLLLVGLLAARAIRARPELLAACALGAAALLVTFSRGAWLGLLAGFVVLALMLVRLQGRSAGVALLRLGVAAALVVAPLAVAYLPALAARTGTQGAIATETRSLDDRGTVAAAAVEVTAAHPLLGVGLGTLPLALQAARPRFPIDYQPASVVLLDAAAETGLPGGLLYLALLVAPWVALVRGRLAWTAELAVASAVLGAVTVVGLFDDYTWAFEAGRIWAWLALGLWAGAWRAAQHGSTAPRGSAAGA